MTANRAGFLISVSVHILAVAGFILLLSRGGTAVKTINLDFSLLKGGDTADHRAGTQGPGPVVSVSARKRMESEQSAPPVIQVGDGGRSLSLADAGPVGRAVQQAEGVAAGPEGTASDPAGQVVIQGRTGTPGGKGAEEGKPAAGGGVASGSAQAGIGGGRLLDYGRGGKAERDFSFIREGVIRQVSYPERARRMGWEGRVVLSFTVLEEGSVRDVKVAESSGYRVLDENARDAVLKARFARKVPYRLTVLLPVEYRLE